MFIAKTEQSTQLCFPRATSPPPAQGRALTACKSVLASGFLKKIDPNPAEAR